MGLKEDTASNRAQLKADWKTAKDSPSKKEELKTLYQNFKTVAQNLKTTAQSENDNHALVLLDSMIRELQEAKDDMQVNPDDWTDLKIRHFHRRCLHLLMGVNPYTTDPTDWEPED